jgi:predicted DCC family thiol-disulfide oxidoreductase YuxK
MEDEPAIIIYDGDCIFCKNYVRLLRLREAVGRVELLNARSGDPRVARYWRLGYDLNEGMLFVYNGMIYHGAAAMHLLARLSSRCSSCNRFNSALFSSRAASEFLYPALKLGRRVTLFLRGKKPLRR